MVDYEYMSIRLGPYLLLSFLLCILLFIVGVKYGTYVERQNKIVAAMPTFAPTKQPQPTESKVAELELVKNKPNACGVTFLYPSFMQSTATASTEAKLVTNTSLIQYSCDIQSSLFDSARDSTLPAETITVNGKKITARVNTSNSKPVYIFTTTNTFTGKPVAFMIDTTLFPLVAKSLEFSR